VSELPDGWAWTTVGEVAELTDGPFGSNLKTAHYVAEGPRVIRLQNISDGVFRDERAHITETHYEQLEKHAVQPDDVVIASLGVDAPRACLVPSWLGPAIVKADCIRARPLAGIEPGFVMWMLNSPPMHRQAAFTIKGIGRPRLGLGGIRQLRLALPPLPEQRRIVAAIEEHLSRIDAARVSLYRVQRLVERWRASALATLSHHEAPQRRIRDVAHVGSGATPKRDRRDYWIDGDVPWVTSGQLTQPFVTEPAAFITQKALRETSCRVWPKGTLLIAMYGEGKTRGHCSQLLIDAATNQACAAIQIEDPEVDPSFLKLYLNASYRANRSLAAGGVQPNLSLGLIKDMSFPCPPRNEQRAIVASIDRQLEHAANLGVAVAKALTNASGLRRSILSRAFRGELVAQDSKEEPASALLKEIAEARSGLPTVTRRRRARTPA
jgi:type I restriction enzyme, S subunit